MTTKAVNEKIEMNLLRDGTCEIRVRSFNKDEMSLYESGMRAALKDKNDIEGKIMLFDFSEISGLQDFDEKALFDIFQFISFNCMRCMEVRVIWGPALLDYLTCYKPSKAAVWKLSESTVKKLIGVSCSRE